MMRDRKREELASEYWRAFGLVVSANRADRMQSEREGAQGLHVLDPFIESRDMTAFELLEAIAASALSEDAIAFFAAGPLQDMVDDWPSGFVSWALDPNRAYSNIDRALQYLVLDDRLARAVARRRRMPNAD